MDSEENKTQDLKHLQSVLLSIMKQIDKFCTEHNIFYYLNGGNALGAVRHKGFIPWDDDFDIMLKYDDYERFLKICRKELDPEKWIIQEAWKDWPGCFSKIRLKNTYLKDVGEWEGIPMEKRGIYIDIFPLVYSPDKKIPRLFQYIVAKLLSSYSLTKKGYTTKSILKKISLLTSKILSIRPLHTLFKKYVFKYDKDAINTIGSLFGMSRFHNAFYSKKIFGNPVYLPYEDTTLPLPTLWDKYLSQTFGDYMKLPPADQQRPAHSLEINFGSY